MIQSIGAGSEMQSINQLAAAAATSRRRAHRLSRGAIKLDSRFAGHMHTLYQLGVAAAADYSHPTTDRPCRQDSQLTTTTV